MTLKQHPDAVLAYCDTSANEHPDNERYLTDCERWYGKPIIRLRSEKYADTWDVFAKTRYLVGPGGARCTTELKKLVRRAFEKPGDVQVYGYTLEERERAERFIANNPEVSASFPLIASGFTHQDCRAIIRAAGVKEPAMYALGYRNNNCIGCVKGGAGYWNKIRVDFPEVYERMSKVERELDVAINKREEPGRKRVRVFLDELPADAGDYSSEAEIECGLFCFAALARSAVPHEI